MTFDARNLAGIAVMAAAAETGNFARAAEMLGLTPSGVSRAIARLEARLGVRLFDRSPRFVRLTEDGRRFHAEVMPLLAGIEAAASGLGGAAVAVSGRLRVNVDPWFARMVLARHLPSFLRQYPALTLDLGVSNHREEMMAGIDVAVRFGPAEGAALIARKLMETRVVTCAAPAYLKQHGTPQTPHDLARHQAILFRDPQTARPFSWGFSQDGREFEVPVKGQMVTDDPSTAVEACVAGQGIFQSLEVGLESWLTEGALVRILGDWSDETFPLYAYHPSRHLPPARVRVFLDFVQRIAGPRDN